MPLPHYTIIIGDETLQRLAKREAVTLTMIDGARVTLIDGDTFPREELCKEPFDWAALARLRSLPGGH